MAINPISSFLTGLYQGYQQSQLQQLQREQRLLDWQRQLLDRAMQVFPHLPVSGKVAVLTGLARFGVVDNEQLASITEELIANEQASRREKLAGIMNKLEGMIRDLPPEHKAVAYTQVFGTLGIKVDEDFVKSLADGFRREGFPRVANALAQVAPNLAKLPAAMQVAVVRGALEQMGYDPDEKMLEAIHRDILKKDAMTQVRDLLPYLDRNRSDAQKIIAGTAINVIARSVEGLPIQPLEKILAGERPEIIALLTKPYGQERTQQEAQREWDRVVRELMKQGVSAEDAMRLAGMWQRGKFGAQYGFMPAEPERRALWEAQAWRARNTPIFAVPPGQIGRLFAVEDLLPQLEEDMNRWQKLATRQLEVRRYHGADPANKAALERQLRNEMQMFADDPVMQQQYGFLIDVLRNPSAQKLETLDNEIRNTTANLERVRRTYSQYRSLLRGYGRLFGGSPQQVTPPPPPPTQAAPNRQTTPKPPAPPTPPQPREYKPSDALKGTNTRDLLLPGVQKK